MKARGVTRRTGSVVRLGEEIQGVCPVWLLRFESEGRDDWPPAPRGVILG